MKFNIQNKLFSFNEIDLNESTCFIYGKNGTGKSSLAEEIKNNKNADIEIMCYKSFEELLSTENKLNGIILGEKNIEIDEKIKEIEEKNNELNKKIAENNSEILKKEQNKYTKEIDELKKSKDKKVGSFVTEIRNNRYVLDPNYTRKKFEKDFFKKSKLDDELIEKYKKIVSEERKEACNINEIPINIEVYYEKIKDIIEQKIEPKVTIERLSTSEKIKFAKKGLELHKVNEICSFCGNKISKENYEKLEKYFSEDNVRSLQNTINSKIKELDEEKIKWNGISISKENFSSKYQREILEIISEFNENKSKYIKNLNLIIEKLREKGLNLFHNISLIISFEQEKLLEILKKYNNVVKKNNDINLEKEEIVAKEKLLLHEIYKFNEDKKLDELYKKLEKHEFLNNKIQQDIENISIVNKNIKCKIGKNNLKINELRSQTISEEKLAIEINKILEQYVNFKIKHNKNSNNGFYEIENIQTHEIRDITKLSTGEKNLIGFLYFINKIDSIEHENKKKVIVFDDPVNSNDSCMQYIIMEELFKLIKSKNDKNIENMIITTHNIHFYINITYQYKRYYSNINYKFMHLEKEKNKTKYIELKKREEDIKSDYEYLWSDLKEIYRNKYVSIGVMCNVIRRIIDTYTNFNKKNKNEFISKVNGMNKLINVNSHEIQNYATEMISMTKDELIEKLQMLFKMNDDLEHFELYFEN